LKDTIVVAPDIGGAKSAYRFAAQLGLPATAADKTRMSDARVQIDGMISKQIQGFRRAIVYDDEIATGGSVIALSRLLIENGIARLSLVCTHGIFTGQALEKLGAIPEIDEIITTDTVPIPRERRLPHLKVLSVAPVFGEAIQRNYHKQSIGDLFAFG
jgi:ribose-phosphate pyrophosphokinase